MNINWFPGHMKKAADAIRDKLKQVDLCCEVIDARIPFSSRNHMLEKLTDQKPRLIILNKRDMADEHETKRWIERLNGGAQRAIALNAQTDKTGDMIYQAAKRLTGDKWHKQEARGIINPEIRMMVFGIPNSGKSTFINNIANRKSAKVGNRPGITTQQQWIRTDVNLYLMDTPGILWHKFTDEQAMHLAYTGAIRDEVLELQEIGFSFIKQLQRVAPQALEARYGVDATDDTLSILEQIAKSIGAFHSGRGCDYHRTAQRILDDFRKVRIGRLTLEPADEYGSEAMR